MRSEKPTRLDLPPIGLLCLILLIVTTGSGCSVLPRLFSDSDAKDTLERWNDGLNYAGLHSDCDQFFALGPGPTQIEGYRLWRGVYRGVPIALYSCVTVQHFVYTTVGGGIRDVRIVLAVEMPDANGRPRWVATTVGEHVYRNEVVDTDKLVRDPRKSVYYQEMAPGRIGIEVKGNGEGGLEYRINVLKQPRWDTFDLDVCLRGYALQGPRKLILIVPDPLTPEESARKMITTLLTFKSTGERWWEGYLDETQINQIDHPMWEDATAMRILLTSAPPAALVHAINFMARKEYKDPNYLKNLNLDEIVLGFARSKYRPVRGAFEALMLTRPEWPQNPKVLEPLLHSTDQDVVSCILWTFYTRHYVPSDQAALRMLLGHSNEEVRTRAREIIEYQASW